MELAMSVAGALRVLMVMLLVVVQARLAQVRGLSKCASL